MVSELTRIIERSIAERSILIKNMLEDVGDEAMTEPIPIPNVCNPLSITEAKLS